MFAVEYTFPEYEEGQSTYEIFETLEEASHWLTVMDNAIPLYIFEADFNTEHIYRENKKDGGGWNYEDFINTFINQTILKDFRKENKNV